MLRSEDQDFVERQIKQLAAAVLTALGVQEAADEDPEELEREAEAWLSVPLDVLRDMGFEATLGFLSAGQAPDPARLLLVGMLIARRAAEGDRRGRARPDELRIKAMGLITRAIEQRPSLIDDEVIAVLQALGTAQL